MNGTLLHRPRLSDGEKRVMIGRSMTGVFGALLAIVVVIRLSPEAVFDRAISGYEWWIITSGFIGGWVGAGLARDRLGRNGARNMVLGILIVTFFGPVVAGTLGLPLYGTMFGPFALALIFVASPVTAGLWVANLLAVHILFRSWHAERDSIFGVLPPEPVLRMLGRFVLRMFGKV